jgi:uncharacterized protein (TIGR02145 family)
MNTQNLLKCLERALKENNVALIEKISRLLEDKRPATPQFGSIDILNRPHKTVVLGAQEWMAVNLFCPELGWHYNNDPKNSEGGYGTLHTHHSIPAIEALLPEGWRVANNQDWDKLIDTIGKYAGTKLKSKEGWESNGGGTDECGFRVLPSGYRYYNGSSFSGRGVFAHFWSSSVNSGQNACVRYFTYTLATVRRYYNYRSYGLSVRCVRDLK